MLSTGILIHVGSIEIYLRYLVPKFHRTSGTIDLVVTSAPEVHVQMSPKTIVYIYIRVRILNPMP